MQKHMQRRAGSRSGRVRRGCPRATWVPCGGVACLLMACLFSCGEPEAGESEATVRLGQAHSGLRSPGSGYELRGALRLSQGAEAQNVDLGAEQVDVLVQSGVYTVELRPAFRLFRLTETSAEEVTAQVSAVQIFPNPVELGASSRAVLSLGITLQASPVGDAGVGDDGTGDGSAVGGGGLATSAFDTVLSIGLSSL
jgi:hypothetical protein